MKLKSTILATSLLAVLSTSVLATEIEVGPVYIESVTVIALPGVGAHSPGNLEVKIKGGFTVPLGITCTGPYITTLKSVDADKRLFILLTTAQATKQPVNARITDDPTYTAFPGRCSFVYVGLSQ